jgi:uncharacterized protein YndB with AHSA1/START domain
MGRRLEKRIELDATPEQVWEVIATDHGTAAWFVPHRIDPEAGTLSMDFGGGFEVAGRITAWEPGHRFAYEGSEPPENGRPDYAYEFVVEGRDGGGTVLRFVQSGFLDGDDWDAEYSSFDTGWDLFLGNVAQYLRHFRGQPARAAVTMSYTAMSQAEAWPAMYRALGLKGRPALGEGITLRPDGAEPVHGVVDVASPEFLGVRSAHGLHRIGAEGEQGCGVSAYHYFYGADVDTIAVTAAWQDWLTRHFPAPAPIGASNS